MALESILRRAVTFMVLGGIFLFPQSSRADYECPSFPKVTFWGNLTHETVRLHVADKLSGDWGAYLKQLARQQKKLARIYGRGSGVIVRRQGKKIKLSGAPLAKYIKHSKTRISVVRCLAEAEEAADFANFSTAAGTPDKTPENKASKRPAAVRTETGRLYLRIPEDLLVKLRKMAVRKSLREARKATVNEIVVEILEKGLKKQGR